MDVREGDIRAPSPQQQMETLMFDLLARLNTPANPRQCTVRRGAQEEVQIFIDDEGGEAQPYIYDPTRGVLTCPGGTTFSLLDFQTEVLEDTTAAVARQQRQQFQQLVDDHANIGT